LAIVAPRDDFRRVPPLPPYRAQLATLAKGPPRGAGWIHEVKYDGYRIGAAVERGRATLWSRNGRDWTAQFPEVAAAVARLPVERALLDGEVAILLPDGRTSFQALQNASTSPRAGARHQAIWGGRRGIVYLAFDLVHLDGEDLAPLPLVDRKARLAALLGTPAEGVVRYSPHVEGEAEPVWREACRLALEGIVSKQRDAPYVPGRGASWLKVKCTLRQELVVGGFTDPEGSREGIGALLVGYHDATGALRFAGKVGTGYTRVVAKALRARLDRLEQDACPFSPPPTGWVGKNAHWVKPELVAEVEFTEWTEGGSIRHPSFQGLREDKRAQDVVRERAVAVPPSDTRTPASRRFHSAAPREAAEVAGSAPASTSKAATTAAPRARSRGAKKPFIEVAGVRITNPQRVVYPELGLTKADLARYYARVADAILPHLRGRPLTLFHCPEGLAGECRFMKHSKVWAPEAVRRISIREKTKTGEYLVVDDLAALLSVVQMDVLELHTWNTTADHLEEPDRVVLDLDPGPAVSWRDVVAAARLVRSALSALRLDSFVKTTGGRGLHVVVPIAPARPWQECLAFSRGLAEVIARHAPNAFTTTFAKRGREQKILIDYLRNNRTNTSVAAFSTRAKPGATVSVPLAWDELDPRSPPERFTLRTVPRRLAALRHDPWAGHAQARHPLDEAALQAVASAPPSLPPSAPPAGRQRPLAP
jgi:bifunctional non-homologous end joining protein LigD